MILCLVALMGPRLAEAQVKITLREDPDDPAAALPKGTTVLVLEEEGTRAVSLDELGMSRDDLRQRLLVRAKESPEALLDTLGAEGKTRDEYTRGSLQYLMARTPEGTLYESQVAGGVGFDLLVSGRLALAPVPDEDRAGVKKAFEEVVATARKTRLRLVTADGDPLPKDTDVRIWAREGDEGRAIPNRGFLKIAEPSYAFRLSSNGKTQGFVERTWHSYEVVYVAAQAPGGRLYESQFRDGAGFDFVYRGEITMAPVPEAAQANVGVVFASSSVFAWEISWGWAIFFLVVGSWIGLAGAWWWYEQRIARARKRQYELKAELSQKSREKYPKSVRQPASPNSSEEKTEEEETVEKMRAKNDELRQEIAELKEKVRAREEKLKTLVQSGSPSAPADEEDPGSQTVSEADPPTGPGESSGTETPDEELAASELEGHPVEKHFVEWCRRDGAMTGRYYMFERALHEHDIDAAVTPIYHDPTTERQFYPNRDVSSQEFWMVDTEGSLFVFPVPKRNGTFRALVPAYEASEEPPTPSALRAIIAARLSAAETGYRLSQNGVLNPDSDSSSPS